MPETRTEAVAAAVETTRVIAIRNVPSDEVVDIVTDLVDGWERGARARAVHGQWEEGIGPRAPLWAREEMGIRIAVASRTNSVIVTVMPEHPEDMDRVDEIIQRLDVGTTRSFWLRHAPAQEAAAILTDLLDASRRMTRSRNKGACVLMLPEYWTASHARGGDDEAGIHIVADSRRHTITVTLHPANPELMDRIAELLQRLDVEDVRER